MNNKLQNALKNIHATEDMKQNTAVFLQNEIFKRQRKTRKLIRYALVCFAALALIVCSIGGYSVYQIPISFISVDVNPSVELGLNRFDRVVTVAAYNDEGTELLQNLNLKNKPYTLALELLLADKLFERFLSEDSLLSFTVVSDKEEALLAGIRQCQGYAESKAECHAASAELMDAAHHNGLSFGKYQAFLELSKYDKTITAQECQRMSMRKIRDRIRQYKDAKNAPVGDGHRGAGQGNRNGQGNGQGYGCNGYRGGRNTNKR